MDDTVFCQLFQVFLVCDIFSADKVEHAEQLVLAVSESEEVIELEKLSDLALESTLPGCVNQLAGCCAAELVSTLACILVLRRVDQLVVRVLNWTSLTKEVHLQGLDQAFDTEHSE